MVLIGLESFILNVLSRFYNEDRQGGSRDKLPGGHTPGGGQRTAAQAAGSRLSSPKFQKETKRPFFVETLKSKRQ